MIQVLNLAGFTQKVPELLRFPELLGFNFWGAFSIRMLTDEQGWVQEPPVLQNWSYVRVLPWRGDIISGWRQNLARKSILWVHSRMPNLVLIGEGGEYSSYMSKFGQRCGILVFLQPTWWQHIPIKLKSGTEHHTTGSATPTHAKFGHEGGTEASKSEQLVRFFFCSDFLSRKIKLLSLASLPHYSLPFSSLPLSLTCSFLPISSIPFLPISLFYFIVFRHVYLGI